MLDTPDNPQKCRIISLFGARLPPLLEEPLAKKKDNGILRISPLGQEQAIQKRFWTEILQLYTDFSKSVLECIAFYSLSIPHASNLLLSTFETKLIAAKGARGIPLNGGGGLKLKSSPVKRNEQKVEAARKNIMYVCESLTIDAKYFFCACRCYRYSDTLGKKILFRWRREFPRTTCTHTCTIGLYH